MSDIERRQVGGETPHYAELDDPDRYDAIYGGQNSWLMFAGLLIFFVGLWNVFEGGIALFRTAFFTASPLFGNLTVWAFVWLALGLLQIGVAYAIIAGSNVGRWIGVVLVVAGSLIHMLSVPIYPFWSLTVLALDVVVLYALLVHGPRRATA